ncbi:proton-conducting transporter transmembrane domain-containing protein, partial [Mycobacterium tuberculosis]|uniref:proton-conducting transporter transmembrane domain-containing protein n=1 Tax=Mycobacterium tuberculosis TaxID=1773 RepID=UPI003F4A615C
MTDEQQPAGQSSDPGVARLAGGLLLIGYGAKAGLFPFYTWLGDAHSQAPAPVSALMSGVVLAGGVFGADLLSAEEGGVGKEC